MRDHLWKRLARRDALDQEKLPADPDERDSFFALIGPHLDPFTGFVHHLIAYAEANGDLVRNEIAVEDLVEDTVLRAYQLFLKNRAEGNVRAWLTHLAAEQLEKGIKGSKSNCRERTVHLEEDVPEIPEMEEVSTLGDEILDFYQPDEDLRVEDLIADAALPSPEEEFGREELRQHVRTEFNALPRKWRRALLLHYMKRLSGAELANAMGLAAPESDRILSYASAYLRQRLVESGCSLNVSRPLA